MATEEKVRFLVKQMSMTMLFTDNEMYLPTKGRLAWDPSLPKPKNIYNARWKLFASELAFLTMVLTRIGDDVTPVVVYAGAAPGYHIPALASLFPKLEFFLYDVRRFRFGPKEKLHIMRKNFNDEFAKEWKETGRTVIFISDVRNADQHKIDSEVAAQVNMTDQARWVEIMKPAWWSIRFRIPYPIVEKGEKYEYLGGWLMLQPFTKALSMEMRLVGNGNIERKPYDTRELEELLFYHNRMVRPKKDLFCNVYSLDDKKYSAEEFNHSYDMTYLLYTIDNYLMSSVAIPFSHSVDEAGNLAFASKLIAMLD